MSTVSCPVCGNFNNTEDSSCRWCSWDVRPVYGLSSAVQDTYEERLAQAKAEWEARNDQPELARDPFETAEEYQQRLASKAWYIGTARLLREHYDIETRRFPLEIIGERDWYRAIAPGISHAYITLQRDSARELYQQSETWPCYASLTCDDGSAAIHELFLEDAGMMMLPVVFEELQPPSEFDLAGYRDNGDGTVTDVNSGLTWLRFALGQQWDGDTTMGKADAYTWGEAFKAVKQFNSKGGFAGKTDWRLPKFEELSSIRREGLHLKLHDRIFPRDSWVYWSSTTFGDGARCFSPLAMHSRLSRISSIIESRHCIRLVREGV